MFVFPVNSTASKPRATLTAQSSIIPAGGSVTLSCSVEGSAGWKFDWFRRDSQFSGAQKIGAGTSEHTISISEGGIYYCRGGRGDPVFSTEDSAPVTIQKQVLAAVKLQHSWSQIFTGETITLRCEIQGGEGKVWKYEWTAPNTNSPPTSSEYRISRVSVSHSGDYRCRGSSDYLLTGWSDAFRLTVSSSKPRATLTAQSSVIPAGGSVTLSCSVEGSAGWKFDWFRRDSVSSKAQLMRGNEANRVISVSQGGLYHCRGGRGDPVYYTEDSQSVRIGKTDVHSAASLTVSPDRVQHFTSDSVSLTCEGNFTEWRVRKFSEDGRLYSDCRRMTGSTCNINTSKSDTAVYWCESGSGEFSSAVNITVQNDGNGPILVSPVHSVTEGASVSLSCSLRTQKILSNVFFYHNDKLIQNDTRGELKISAVSKSDEGFYKCQYSGRESAQSWMSVKVTVSGGDSSSSPVWLIVGLVCGVSLIIILLLLLYRCRQSKCADKPPDVIYSNIELENFGNEWKHHKPEQSAVYTNVKTGAAEDSLMYAEVKQPKKEKAKKNKGKSSPAADAAVYSEVTSGSSLSQ
ncbi:unnamed protein product [Oreochromis niloticus]|nr:unnamed protein product [Mustela putorius furo]